MKKIYLVLLFILAGTCPLLAQPSAPADSIYVCGPCGGSCDNLQFDKAGICPHCNMALQKTSLADFKRLLALKPVIICFYLQDGVEVLDFAGPMEIFAVAGFKVFTVSKNKKPIISQGVLSVTPDYSIADAPQADILVVFGGNTAPTESDPDVIGG